jgi:acetyl esterase/lipase
MTRNGDLHPALFRPQAILAETRAVNAGLVAGRPLPSEICAARVDIYEIRTRRGMVVTLRVIATPRARGVYLHIPGGDWVMGAPDRRDGMLARIAAKTGMACVSVDYRRGPDHPYPAAPDDCEAAALWLIGRARELFGTALLTIGGESTGAQLAAITLLRLRDAGHGRAFAAANLAFGLYDLGLTPSARAAAGGLTDRRRIEAVAADFVPAAFDRRHPDISPLHADLRGLPPALFTVGTLDALVDDTLFMHGRWIAAGNEAELAIHPGGVHGFTALPGQLSAQAAARIDCFLARAIGAVDHRDAA